MLEILPCTLADLDAIVSMDMELADFHHELDELHKTGNESEAYFRTFYSSMLQSEDAVVLAARKDEQIVGFLSGEMKPSGSFDTIGKCGCIEAIQVHKEYRSQGVGTKLLEAFFSWAERKGAKQFQASTHARNVDALRYWKKQGFEESTIVFRKQKI